MHLIQKERSTNEICALKKSSKSTISKIRKNKLQNLKKRNPKKRGPPNILTECHKHQIKRLCAQKSREGVFFSPAKIAHELNLGVSARTVNRMLKEIGYQARKIQKKHFLTKNTKSKSVNFVNSGSTRTFGKRYYGQMKKNLPWTDQMEQTTYGSF